MIGFDVDGLSSKLKRNSFKCTLKVQRKRELQIGKLSKREARGEAFDEADGIMEGMSARQKAYCRSLLRRNDRLEKELSLLSPRQRVGEEECGVTAGRRCQMRMNALREQNAALRRSLGKYRRLLSTSERIVSYISGDNGVIDRLTKVAVEVGEVLNPFFCAGGVMDEWIKELKKLKACVEGFARARNEEALDVEDDLGGAGVVGVDQGGGADAPAPAQPRRLGSLPLTVREVVKECWGSDWDGEIIRAEGKEGSCVAKDRHVDYSDDNSEDNSAGECDNLDTTVDASYDGEECTGNLNDTTVEEGLGMREEAASCEAKEYLNEEAQHLI